MSLENNFLLLIQNWYQSKYADDIFQGGIIESSCFEYIITNKSMYILKFDKYLNLANVVFVRQHKKL